MLKGLNCFKVNSLITGQTPQGDNTKPIKKSTDIKKRDNLSGKNSKGGGHIYSYVREEWNEFWSANRFLVKFSGYIF